MLTPNNDESLALRAFDIFRRRKLLATAVFGATLASALSFAVYLPDLYRATAVVLVERPVPESFVRPAVTGELETRLHVIKQEILSRTRLTALINRFDLYPDMRKRYPLDTALDQMRHDMEIELTGPEQVSGRKTTVAFKLSYTGATGATVAGVTNALAAFYVEQNYSIRSGEATRTTDFLKAQLDATKKQLDQREREIREYTSSHPGELPQQVEVNLAAIERLNTQLRLNGERQLKVLEDREKLSERATAPLDAPMSDQAAAAQPQSERIERMKRELQLLEGQFTSRYPDVVRLKTELARLEREHQDALVRDAEPAKGEAAKRETGPAEAGQTSEAADAPVPPPGTARRKTLEGLSKELDRLKTEEASLRLAIGNLEKRLEGVPERQQEYGRITRDYQGSKDLYDSLLKRYGEAQVGESMEVDRQGETFRILEPALPPPSPVAPNRLRLLVVGLLLAVAAGVGAALVAEQFDSTFHSSDALREFTSVPVLATIPVITSGTARQALRWTLAAASIIVVIALAAVMSAHVAQGNEQIVWMLARGA
jgi:polysaccharide chain length determinant protein (PEP-CTERM system associated)